MTKPQMPQMTPEQWESLATAVDALSSALAAVRPLAEWEMDLLSAATPEPDPWPTAPLIVASVDGGGPQLLSVLTTHSAATMTSAIVRRSESTLTNIVPVTPVPVAELRHSREMLAAADAGDFDSFLDSFRALIAATDALGVDL